MTHVRTLVVWNQQLLLVQHHNPRNDVIFWMPPGGGSEGDETAEEAARREVKEETGLDVRSLRQLPLPLERGYVLVLAELVGPPDLTPEVEACEGEIHTIGAGWHPVTNEAPLGPMEAAYWAELAPFIREQLGPLDR